MRALLAALLLLAVPYAAYAVESFTRAGIALGGTGFLSLRIERHYGDSFARVNIGILEPRELCLSASVHRGFTVNEISPHMGIGIMNVLIFPEGKFGHLDLLNLSAGIEGNLTDRNALGMEGDLNIFLRGRNPGGGKATFGKGGLRSRMLMIPAVYYLRR